MGSRLEAGATRVAPALSASDATAQLVRAGWKPALQAGAFVLASTAVSAAQVVRRARRPRYRQGRAGTIRGGTGEALLAVPPVS